MRAALRILGVCCAALLLLVLGSVLDQLREVDAAAAPAVRIVPDRARHASAAQPPRRLHASTQPAEASP